MYAKLTGISMVLLLALLTSSCGNRQPHAAAAPDPLHAAFTAAELGTPLDRKSLNEKDKALLGALEEGDVEKAKLALKDGANARLDCGMDFMSGHFTGTMPDPKALAAAMYAFCPDIVDQGTGSVTVLEKELRKKNEFYFWWD